MNKTSILIVEDDRPIRNLIVTTLKTHEYKYLTAENGREAILEASSHNPDIILLDLGLPDMEGVDVIKKFVPGPICRLLLSVPEVRILIRLRLLTQVRMIILQNLFQLKNCLHVYVLHRDGLRLFRLGEIQKTAVFINGELKIDYTAGCTYMRGEELHLTPIEYKLLCLLSRNVGKVLTHTYITQQIWGRSSENDVASLRVFMATLRKNLNQIRMKFNIFRHTLGLGIECCG